MDRAVPMFVKSTTRIFNLQGDVLDDPATNRVPSIVHVKRLDCDGVDRAKTSAAEAPSPLWDLKAANVDAGQQMMVIGFIREPAENLAEGVQAKLALVAIKHEIMDGQPQCFALKDWSPGSKSLCSSSGYQIEFDRVFLLVESARPDARNVDDRREDCIHAIKGRAVQLLTAYKFESRMLEFDIIMLAMPVNDFAGLECADFSENFVDSPEIFRPAAILRHRAKIEFTREIWPPHSENLQLLLNPEKDLPADIGVIALSEACKIWPELPQSGANSELMTSLGQALRSARCYVGFRQTFNLIYVWSMTSSDRPGMAFHVALRSAAVLHPVWTCAADFSQVDQEEKLSAQRDHLSTLQKRMLAQNHAIRDTYGDIAPSLTDKDIVQAFRRHGDMHEAFLSLIRERFALLHAHNISHIGQLEKAKQPTSKFIDMINAAEDAVSRPGLIMDGFKPSN